MLCLFLSFDMFCNTVFEIRFSLVLIICRCYKVFQDVTVHLEIPEITPEIKVAVRQISVFIDLGV